LWAMEHYRVRIRRGDAELEVDSSDREYVENKLAEFGTWLGAGAARDVASLPSPPAPPEQTSASTKPVSLVEHVRKIGPKTGTQYVMAVGHYLEQFGGMGQGFKTRDLGDAFQSLKYKHSNPAEAVRQARSQGFLMDGKEPNTVVLTQRGEAWVSGQLVGGEES
jgi:hypothetical protein